MKHLFLTVLIWLITIQLNAQITFSLKGKVLNTELNSNTLIRVFEFDEVHNDWKETKCFKTNMNYLVKLSQNKNYQVWFTDVHNFTKITAINKGTIMSSLFELNVDFYLNESVQILRDNFGMYNLKMIDTDFVALKTPWDLYP